MFASLPYRDDPAIVLRRLHPRSARYERGREKLFSEL
jgi:hypothetical protein